MMISRELLSEQQRIMVDSLIEGVSIKETAERCGVTPKTIWTWRQIPLVKHFVLEGLAEKHDVSGGQGTSMLPEVMTRMKEIATSPLSNTSISNSDRIAAAKVIIAGAADYQNRKILERQINLLETRLVKLSSAVKIEVEDSLNLRSADPDEQEREEEEEDSYDVATLSTEDIEEERRQLLLEQAAELLDVTDEE